MTPRRPPAALALTMCGDYEAARVREALIESIGQLGGLQKFVRTGDSVLLKPNFIAPAPRENAAQTDPEIIVQLAVLLKEIGAKPFVGDSPAWGTVFDCVRALGLVERLQKLDVPVRQLNKPRWIKVQPSGARVGISSIALDCDKIINLPKLKDHRQLGATIAVKNMFGCVSGKAKPLWHYARGSSERRFSEMLLGVYNSVTPALNIVDGITAMEAGGPINGKPRKLGIIVTSADPFACEIVCAEIIGIAEQDLPILRTAREIGLCSFTRDDIAVLGSRVEDCICPDFVHLERIPIKFTLARVCKSLVKQIVKLAGSAIRIN
ncbi:MAG TPA: DUF362 domain-containing protein [Sedimentisphaerales bacterium]|nr:DUF362 domain-containing protein [Sedimentisphaerales bacterium]